MGEAVPNKNDTRDVRRTSAFARRGARGAPAGRCGVDVHRAREIMPRSLAAFERYVSAGGVAVWAAGNGRAFHPVEEAALPLNFPDLEKGWLAVVGVNPDGRISPGT